MADGGREPSREGPVRAEEDRENGRRFAVEPPPPPGAAISGAERPTAGSAAVGPDGRLAAVGGACGRADADADVAASSGKCSAQH